MPVNATDLTVCTVVEHEGYYLMVEERATGRALLNQPGGHVEAGESAEAAVLREVMAKTACYVACGELIGVYLWIHPQTRQQYVRIVFAAGYLGCDEERKLDDRIAMRRWMTMDELEKLRNRIRSPVVLRCLHDYRSGRRQSDSLLTGMLPLQNNVDAVLAKAVLV